MRYSTMFLLSSCHLFAAFDCLKLSGEIILDRAVYNQENELNVKMFELVRRHSPLAMFLQVLGTPLLWLRTHGRVNAGSC